MAVTAENASKAQHAPIRLRLKRRDRFQTAPDTPKHAFGIDPKAERVDENTICFSMS
jgi:hypothetical protein